MPSSSFHSAGETDNKQYIKKNIPFFSIRISAMEKNRPSGKDVGMSKQPGKTF
jgi:hypothetical protein